MNATIQRSSQPQTQSFSRWQPAPRPGLERLAAGFAPIRLKELDSVARSRRPGNPTIPESFAPCPEELGDLLRYH